MPDFAKGLLACYPGLKKEGEDGQLVTFDYVLKELSKFEKKVEEEIAAAEDSDNEDGI